MMMVMKNAPYVPLFIIIQNSALNKPSCSYFEIMRKCRHQQAIT